MYAAWETGDFRTTAGIYDPLVVFVPIREFPGAASHYLGSEGVREFTMAFFEPWTSLTIAAEEVIEIGDSVVVAALWRAEGRESGVQGEKRVFDVWTFRGDKAIRIEFFSDRAEALQAVGLQSRSDNVALAHAVIDAVEHRDVDRLIELTDPDVEWRSAFVAGTGGVYRGHAGVREYVRDMNDAWDVVRLDVDHEIGVGDAVMFVGRIQYRGKGSGVEAESESGYLLKFREGRVVIFRPFREPEKALAEIGL